jgi:hypothetical protein
MIMKLVYKILNIKPTPRSTKMKWVWLGIHCNDDKLNKFVDISKKM